MIASDCNVETFLDSLDGNNLMDLLYTAEQEAVSAERSLYSRNPERRIIRGEQYAGLLKHFISYMRYGCRPRGIEPAIFKKFCEVKKRFTIQPRLLPDRTKIQYECD